MKLVACVLVAALALPALSTPALAQARSKANIQAELETLTAQKQQLDASLNAVSNQITQLRQQRMQKNAGVPYNKLQASAGFTPETNADLVDQAGRSGRDIYDEAIDKAQNQKSDIQRQLSQVKQQIDKDKAELKTAS
ncbi:MAG TPA: hypothetical protein VG942_13235 [Hyphomonadaceae bacterium]|nr:hypothetical protein [Hyphomonadaceae bacterium]